MSKISIGVTINLGNYENIRIDVSRNIHTIADYIDLHRELFGVINDYTNSTVGLTHEAFAKFQSRVLVDPKNIQGWV